MKIRCRICYKYIESSCCLWSFVHLLEVLIEDDQPLLLLRGIRVLLVELLLKPCESLLHGGRNKLHQLTVNCIMSTSVKEEKRYTDEDYNSSNNHRQKEDLSSWELLLRFVHFWDTDLEGAEAFWESLLLCLMWYVSFSILAILGEILLRQLLLWHLKAVWVLRVFILFNKN